MAYTDFTLESAEETLGVTVRLGDLFPGLAPVAVPGWLTDQLSRGQELALVSEKARSEFILAPILLAVRELSAHSITILSGQRLDVEPQRSLLGECDFLLTRSEPLPRLSAPIVTIVEAKRNDIDAGLGECVAQMVGAQIYNERAGEAPRAVTGCVTTGENWQFLGLRGSDVTFHRPRYYIDGVGMILAAFSRAVGTDF